MSEKRKGWISPIIELMLARVLSNPRRVPRDKKFFEYAMLLRAVDRWGHTKATAAYALAGWERDIGAKYGDPDHDWSVSGAWAIVDDFLEDR